MEHVMTMPNLINPDWISAVFTPLPIAAAIIDLNQNDYPLVYVNPAFERLTGCASADAMGHGLGFLSRENADLRPLQTALAAGQTTKLGLRCQRKDGLAFDCELSFSPVADGQMLALLNDITEQQKNLTELTAERDRLLGFIESAPLGMIALDWVSSGVAIINATGNERAIIYVNAAFEKLTGYRGEEVVGKPYGFFFDGEENQAALQAINSALSQGQALRIELRSYRKDGGWCWTELTLSPVYDENGQLTHLLGVQTDISERKESEQRLQHLSKELRRSRDNLVAILNEFPNGTLIIEADGTVTFCSASCEEIIGVKPELAIGRHWREVFPVNPKTAQPLQRALAAPAATRELLDIAWQGKGGETRWVECAVKDDPRDPVRRLVFLEDVSELRQLRETLNTRRYGGLVGESESMRELNRLIGEIAKGDWTVLIEGETGVGKELVAQGIHEASPRRAGPYIAVNSAGLSESLLASQLFGHKKGAFTGATSDQEGFFEAASGGTIFLDEIGDLPLPMQASLLRVLQEREITRLGETRTRRVDVRVIAATHKDLAAETKAGRFREDLLFRLRVARVLVPPLRGRKTDVPLLVEHFLAAASHQAGKAIQSLSAEAWQSLLAYDWPGNVRELRACMDFAAIYCQGTSIQTGDLPPELRAQTPSPSFSPETFLAPEGNESERIQAALKQAKGNRSKAAKLLGMSRATLYRRLGESEAGD